MAESVRLDDFLRERLWFFFFFPDWLPDSFFLGGLESLEDVARYTVAATATAATVETVRTVFQFGSSIFSKKKKKRFIQSTPFSINLTEGMEYSTSLGSPGSSWKSSFLHPTEEMKHDLFNPSTQAYSTNRLLSELASNQEEMVASEISKVLIIYTGGTIGILLSLTQKVCRISTERVTCRSRIISLFFYQK
jgi:hypothetical protein